MRPLAPCLLTLVLVLVLALAGMDAHAQFSGAAPRVVTPVQSGAVNKATSDTANARATTEREAAEAKAKAEKEAADKAGDTINQAVPPVAR